MDPTAIPVDPPHVALIEDEEDKMFSNALLEIQKEYGAMRDSLPTYASYTKHSYECLQMAVKQVEAEMMSYIESSRSSEKHQNRNINFDTCFLRCV